MSFNKAIGYNGPCLYSVEIVWSGFGMTMQKKKEIMVIVVNHSLSADHDHHRLLSIKL